MATAPFSRPPGSLRRSSTRPLSGPLLVQGFQVLHQVLAGVLLELRDAHPAVARLDQLGLDALHADDVAHQRHLEGLGVAFPHDGEPDGGLGLAAHALDRIVEGHAFHRRVVELDDQVAGLDAGAERRRVLDRRNHLDEAVFHADLDAEAAELALRADLQFLECLLVEIGRVRIEAGQHAVDRLGDELLVLDRLDIVALDRAEHLGKRAQFVHRQREARRSLALRDRREIEAEQDACQHADQHQARLFDLGYHELLRCLEQVTK